MKQKIANLVSLSQKIGCRLDYVQGGGGNISVKISDELMAIKASGYELKNLTAEDGFAFVNHASIKQAIELMMVQKNGDDEKFSAVVKSEKKIIPPYPDLRPSMETGFHSILPYDYVIHTHSLYASILACCKEGKKNVSQLFPQAVWIDYANPGWELVEAIQNKVSTEFPKILFLQNHGLIVAENTADAAINLHEEINQAIISHLDIPHFSGDEVKMVDAEFMKKNVLFPDQIVFGISQEFAMQPIAKQIFSCYSFILQSIENLGLTPCFIAQKNVEFVANMENEKYRKELAKK